jgi:putative transposase
VLDTVEVGRPRREPEDPQFLDPEQAGALIEQAREQGVELLGAGGLLKQMTKAVLERALAEELINHLGYEVGATAGNGSGNSRNGYTSERLLTEAGTVDLDVPRDRNGTHEPQIVRKGQRRLGGIDKIVIGLYAHGMTVRDIQSHLLDIYEIDVSADLISKITDAVLDEVREWHARPLEPVWAVIFLDAIACKVRDSGTVKNCRRRSSSTPRTPRTSLSSRPPTWPSASVSTARRRSWGSGSSTPRARQVLAAGDERPQGPRLRGRPHRGV